MYEMVMVMVPFQIVHVGKGWTAIVNVVVDHIIAKIAFKLFKKKEHKNVLQLFFFVTVDCCLG